MFNSVHGLKFLLVTLVLSITGCFSENIQTDKTIELAKQDVRAKSIEFENFAFTNLKGDYRKQSVSNPTDCTMVLQFVSSGSEGIPFIQAHIKNFKSDNRLKALPICINQPIWFESSNMPCSNDANVRLKCDISPLINLADERGFTHAVVVGNSGKANVHNGIMYLDFNDSYSVFVHELAHFAGFVDEYPLATELANNICKVQIHPNILVYEPSTIIDDNLIAVRTCDNHANQAFKLVKEMTFMEYHDAGLIPKKYLNIWIQRLRAIEQLTPAYVNFAQYYEDLGDSNKAEKWWQNYQEYL